MKRPLPRTPASWLKEIKRAIADAAEAEPFGRAIGDALIKLSRLCIENADALYHAPQKSQSHALKRELAVKALSRQEKESLFRSSEQSPRTLENP